MAKPWRTIILAGLLAGCAGEDEPDSAPHDLEPPSTADTVGGSSLQLDAELPLLLASSLTRTAEEPGSDIGTVRVLQSGDAGSLAITIELNDVRPGSHGWEIRADDCAAATDSAATSPASRTAGVTGTIDVTAAGFGEASALVPTSALDASQLGRSGYSLVLLGLPSPGTRPGVIACADL
ncbi:MAG TPA: hypothetical protein VMN78_09345 [Longimicrobiales bacterium]|nr:hypothetical protein [Longimicrobiales bacterium]